MLLYFSDNGIIILKRYKSNKDPHYGVGVIKKIKLSAVVLALSMLVGGCGDSEADSAPPVANLRLLSRMFESMEKGDYASAGEQYSKYVLSTEEGVSPLWGAVIRSNSVIQNVQKRLDSGDLDGALKIAREAKLSDPLNMDMDALVNELELLTRLRDAASGVRSAADSAVLDVNLRLLSEAMAVDPKKSAPLKPVLEQGVKRLAVMRRRESRMRRMDLLADVYSSGLASDRVQSTLRAQYELERRSYADDPLPEVVENELYKRSR